MTSKHTLGMVPEIADFIHHSSPIASSDLALGAAIAVMSSFAAGRYCIQPKGVPEASVVTQGVMLLGECGTGKGAAMEGAERLFQVVGDPAIATGFSTPEVLWNSATQTPGLLLLLANEDHHSLAARDPGFGQERPQPAQSDVLFSLQSHTTGMDAVFYPRPSRSADFKRRHRQAPVTILAETTPQAMRERLPLWMDSSPFYGELLFVGAVRLQKVRNPAPCRVVPPTLLARLRELTALRPSVELVMVQMDQEAEADYRTLVDYCRSAVPPHEPDAMALLAQRVLNVATLYAIGIDHRQPVVTRQLIKEAANLAVWSRELARAGLQGVPRDFTELVADQFPVVH
ncbi:hypothetical protein F3I62_03520 [Pseudomonas sp. R-28-1W-6]|uniref:hypothetical protein n=1 Tax=Pseudomonas sp. R-28-1W-6 TaxID=2650101 RepID=UPI0013654396|nr:hypothetical protein [Pseudomonas sp. R-28-1W-6]MWV11157.1 hypothetical protein [Pseudomonas sp. R-28-1W-6]